MNCGKVKTVPMKKSTMARFNHGRPPYHSSQINLLASDSYSYRSLYEIETNIATKKTDSIDTIKIRLKSCVNLGYRHTFRSGVDITSLDLETN